MREDSFSGINEDPLPHSLSFNLEKSNNSSPTDVCKLSSSIVDGPRKREKGIYERSLSRLQDRALKIKSIEQTMMKEYTFSPSINPPATLENECKVAVWERLYPDKKSKTHKKSNIDSLRDKNKNQTTTRSVDTNSTESSRIQKLYRKGVKKSISRTARTDKEEDALRQQRHEELRLRSCTFKPTMRWTVKTLSPKKRLSPLRSKNLTTFLTREHASGTFSNGCNAQEKKPTMRSTVKTTLSPKKIRSPQRYKSMTSSTPEVMSKSSSIVAQEEVLHDKFEADEEHGPPLQTFYSPRSPLTYVFDCKVEMVAVSPLREPSFPNVSQSSLKSEDSIESIIEYGSI